MEENNVEHHRCRAPLHTSLSPDHRTRNDTNNTRAVNLFLLLLGMWQTKRAPHKYALHVYSLSLSLLKIRHLLLKFMLILHTVSLLYKHSTSHYYHHNPLKGILSASAERIEMELSNR